MKKILIVIWIFWVFFWLYTFSSCISWAQVCEDVIDVKEIPSDEDIKMLMESWVIEVSSWEYQKFWLEQIKAYYWSLNNWITTKDSASDANLDWRLTRVEMAKMISKYAINIQGKEPDTLKTCLFSDVSENLDLQYDGGVTLACQLWIMWQWIVEFRPNDYVTRAEFWTSLSRTLWWDKYEWWSPYYERHLKALKSNRIMNDITSRKNNEIRWYVMLMLMRSVGDLEEAYNIDNQLIDVVEMLD